MEKETKKVTISFYGEGTRIDVMDEYDDYFHTNGGQSVRIFEDADALYNYISDKEMWYSMSNGLYDYVLQYGGDVEEYITLKFVLALNDEQLWELKNFNCVTSPTASASRPWTYAFDGLYETVFGEPAPATKINEVSASADSDNKITVTVDSSYTRGRNVFAVSYKGGALVDSEAVADGTATLEGNADTVKVFCWRDFKSMVPLCPAGEATVQ